MGVVIELVISAIGCLFCDMDFCTLFTFISIANTLYKNWIDYTNDKATRR